jgi:hypothetical protein
MDQFDSENLTTLRDQMTDTWFGSLKVGDKVYSHSMKWKNKQIVEKTLREGIVKEIHNNDKFNRYILVDNLTTGRQNKWNDYDLIKSQEIEDISERLRQLLSDTESIVVQHKSINEYPLQSKYKQLSEDAEELLKNSDTQSGNCIGIYGAFNKNTGECIYIGKSKAIIARRWREHERFWKRLRPIHRQSLLTQYLYFFKDQIEWRVLMPLSNDINNDLIEYCERRLFEDYQPIANTIIPNGTILGRSVMEDEGESISVSEWNPNMVTIKISKGDFDCFSDGKTHFVNEKGTTLKN